MTGAIVPQRIEGHICAVGPTADIRAALRGASPLTISHGHAAGDRVWLAPRTQQVWRDDAATVETTDIAQAVQHPQRGEILAAYIDMDRLAQAPTIAAIDRKHRLAVAAESRARRTRVDATVPTCDHCGDCPQCC